MKDKKAARTSASGFNNLLSVHTKALEDNSKSIIEILELLSEKGLSSKDKRALTKISKELKGIDKRLDSLGKNNEVNDEEDWF